jgi:DNA-directed RNA polymerase subunit A'
MDKEVSEITEIQFGLYSPEELKKIAVCKVENPKLALVDKSMSLNGTVYDQRMGVIQNGSKCSTCGLGVWLCSGHIGIIELNEPIIHPLFYKNVVQILKCICMKCHGLLITKEQIELEGLLKYKGIKRLDMIIEKLNKVYFCQKCNSIKCTLKYIPSDNSIYLIYKNALDDGGTLITIITAQEIKNVFDEITDDDVKLLGFNPTLMHPKSLVMSYFPVIPTPCRPFVINEGMFFDDDLTILITEILKSNIGLVNSDENKRTKSYNTLKAKIGAFFNNSGNKIQMTNNGKPIQGIKQRLSGKSGQIRSALLAKRVEGTARAVATGPPFLKINQVGIPEQVAQTLLIPVHINQFNIKAMTKLLEDGLIHTVTTKNGLVTIDVSHYTMTKGTRLQHGDIIHRTDGTTWECKDPKILIKDGEKIERDGMIIPVEYAKKRTIKLNINDIIERELLDGDIVLLNRQPSLHQGSMIGLEVVRLKNKCLSISLSITPSLNADFDGGKINLCFLILLYI